MNSLVTNPNTGLPIGVRLDGAMDTPIGVIIHFHDHGTKSGFSVKAAELSPATILEALTALRERYAKASEIMDQAAAVFANYGKDASAEIRGRE